MRRILGVVAVSVGLLVATACQPTEPAMTITAKPDSTTPYCGGGDWIRGKVTPASATPQVVLQRTKDGKWEDWIWRISYDSRPPAKVTSKVSEDGSYAMPYAIPLNKSTLHLRVRSDGGTKFSPGFYVTPKAYPGGTCG